MRIGIIALNFQPGTIGGVETYFRTLIEQLQSIDNRNEYIVVLPEGQKAEIPITNSQFTIMELKPGRDIISKIIQKNTFTPKIGYRSRLARQIDDLQCDLLHFPIQIMLPYDVRTPSIVSCMDIQHEYLPSFFSSKQLLARQMIYKRSLLRAKHTIVISDFVKDSLHEKYQIDNAKMTTVHLCINEKLFNSERREKLPLKKMPDKYLFYPAATWPHKNHERLLQAFSLVAKQFSDISLVLSGIAVQKKSHIEKLINELKLSRKVHVLGYLEYSEIPLIYQNAYALIFPSLYEGFGLPVIEAMYAGCPVICSNDTSLPEIAGKAAIYFNPLDVDDIARAAIYILNNPDKRADLITEGKKNVLRFSGSKLARETIAVYERNK
jgi:glycosyltransferase involved in cell wall biosynthesis